MKRKVIFTMLTLIGSIGMAFGQQNKAKAAASAIVEVQAVSKIDSILVLDPAKKDDLFIKPDQNERFVVEFEPAFPRTIIVSAKKPNPWVSKLYLESGDHISITMDTTVNFKFSGKGAVKQEILFAEQKKMEKYFNETDFKKISANDLLSLVKRNGDASISLLTANKDKVSPVFYKEQMINLQYWQKSLVFSLPRTLNRYGNRKISTVIPDGYWELDKGIKQDDALLSNQEYVNFMSGAYITFLRIRSMFAQGKIDSTLSNEKLVALNYALQEKNLNGKLRSIALERTLSSAFSEAKNVVEYKPLLDKYLAQYADENDGKKTLDSYNSYAKTNVGQVPPFFSLKDRAGKEVSLKDFAGKVVYMDFWASWCGPCRGEMQNGSPKLHFKFKDNKDVVFLYISIDDRADLWEKAMKEDKIEGIHLLSIGGFKSEVARAFNIGGIPHYIIIGRDGKIFDNNAPRPSEDTTPIKINEALKAGV